MLFTVASGERVIHVARLLDQIWPDADGDAAHNRFHVCLHRLRKHLRDSSVIERVQAGYSLCDDVAVDLHDIRMLLTGTPDVQALKDLFDAVNDGRVARQALGDWFFAFEEMIVEYQHKAGCLIAQASLQDGDTQTALWYVRAVLREDAANFAAKTILQKCNEEVTLRGAL